MPFQPRLPTRFDVLPRVYLSGIALILLLMIALGFVSGVAIPKGISDHPGQPGDGALYARIIDRIADGDSYYHAATDEQRMRGYPLHPVVTVRLPTLATLLAALPGVPARRGVFITLTLLAMGAWGWRLWAASHRPGYVAWGLFCLYFACMFGFTGKTYLFHECWAGLLMLLSLALWDGWAESGRKRWLVLAVLTALAAALIRELAVPYLAVMAGMALWERRRSEAALWLGCLAVFAAFMLWHAAMLAPFVQAGDHYSQGWSAMLGWPGALMMARWNGFLILSPPLVTIVLVPLMGLGAAGWPGRTGTRLMLICFGYCAGFCAFGRLNTAYWGLIFTPLMGLALSCAPLALTRLAAGVFGGRNRP